MGKKRSVEARAAGFIEKVAQKLARRGISDLTPHLENAVSELPAGELQSALASDIPRFASRLRECIAEITPAASDAKPEKKSPEFLLRASQSPLFTDEAFHLAARALLAGAQELLPGDEKLPDWIFSCRRLLASRPHAPLSLWWTYSALELFMAVEFQGKSPEQRCMHVVSIARVLLDRLRSLTIGRCDSFTSVAVLAPVVASLVEAGCILKSVPDKSSKPWRTSLKSFREASREVLSYINLHSSRKPESFQSPEPGKGENEMILKGLLLASSGLSRVTGMNELAGRKGAEKNFPLLAREMNPLEICDMQSLASLVSGEAFLLDIMVRILEHRSQRRGDSSFESPEFCDELRFLAVHNIDLLCDLLIDAKLSVEPLLNTDEEVFLRGILYDVITLDSPWPQDKYPVYMKKLILGRRAIQYYRLNGARTKALKLASRLCLWEIPAGFSEWLQSLKFKRMPSDQTLNDSRALIGWITETADEGQIASILAKCTKRKFNRQKRKPAEEEEFGDTFIVDTKGEPSALEALDQAFVEACETMRKNRAEIEACGTPGNDESGDESEEKKIDEPDGDESDDDVEKKIDAAPGSGKMEVDAQVLDSGDGENNSSKVEAGGEVEKADEKLGAAEAPGENKEAADEEFNAANEAPGESKKTEVPDEKLNSAEEEAPGGNKEGVSEDLPLVPGEYAEAMAVDVPGDNDAAAREAGNLHDHTTNNSGGVEEDEEMVVEKNEEDDDEEEENDRRATTAGRAEAVSARDAAESLRHDVQAVLDEATAPTGVPANEAAVSNAHATEVAVSNARATGASDPVIVDSDSDGEDMETDAPTGGEKNLIILAETPPENQPSVAPEAGASEADKQLPDDNETKATVPDTEAKDMKTGGAPKQREQQTTTDPIRTTATDDDVILLELASPPEKKRPGRRKKPEPQTPKPDAPGALQQTPSLRFTRSGRKYGDMEAVGVTSRKKRKATKDEAAAAGRDE